jgi:hypothetical protein
MHFGTPRMSCVRLRNVVASWIDPSRISAAHARDVRERNELLERNGVVGDRTLASRIAGGREGRSVALLGKRKLSRARESEPVA